MTNAGDQILRVFLQEGAEQIEALNSLLLRLESHPRDPDVLAQLMRTAHNLKGAAGTAGLDAIAGAAHKVEDIIERLKTGALMATPALFDVLFKTMDVLDATLKEVSTGKEELYALGRAVSDLDQFLAARHPDQGAAPDEAGGKGGFVLGEYDHIRIRVLKQRGKRLLRIELTVPSDDQDPMPWVNRAFRALRTAGDIVATIPAEIDLKTVEKSRRLAVLLGTNVATLEIEKILAKERPEACRISDVADASAAPANSESRNLTMRGTFKVDVDRVDSLVDMIGELVIAESMVAHSPEILALASRTVHTHLAQLTRITRELQDAGLRLRMVPLRSVFQVMARTVRDLARKHAKTVNFVTTGDDVEMDRGVVEKMTDPLMHLVRNSVDHGVEPSEERVRLGKSATATISLSAFHQGGNIVVEVRDDGRGLDREAIVAKARQLGLVREGTTPSENDAANFIFESGFSTAEKVTDTSGRGVGLDIVRRNVESMRGRVTVSSEVHRGTTMRMSLPLTLAIIDGMLIACGKERYIIPTIAIVESIRPKTTAIYSIAGRRQVLDRRGTMLPMVSLGSLFGIDGACRDAAKGLVVVVEGTGRTVGLVIDDVLSQQQVVIKSVGDKMAEAKYFSGAAILPDGSVGLILNIDEIAAAQALIENN